MSANYKELVELQKQIQQLEQYDIDKFTRDATNEIAQRLFAKAVKRTPVGQYPKGSGKVGGTLRRGWTMTKVKQIADGYEVQVINPTEYASYVEYGHRTRGHKGWVEGRFMLTKSELEIESEMLKIIERKLTKFLQDKLK